MRGREEEDKRRKKETFKLFARLIGARVHSQANAAIQLIPSPNTNGDANLIKQNG